MKLKVKHILLFLLSAILIATLVAYQLYRNYLVAPLSSERIELYIDTTSTVERVIDTLSTKVDEKGIARLERIISLRGYEPSRKVGHYIIEPHMSAYRVYTTLSRGLQTPVKVVFNNLRTKQQLIDRVAEQLIFSPQELAPLLSDSATTAALGFDTLNVVSMFIPDTYELYWSVTPQQFLQRMERNYRSFWSDQRMEQLKKVGLSQQEVSVLASIVEEETKRVDEMPTVAGLYLNRLRRGMLLQADPTVKFALQQFELRRILLEHLAVDSPYNTYKYVGLPPSPIRIPSKAAIDAVLNYERHSYLYMCAKEDFSGRHNFARTLSQHNLNAQRYHRALSQRKIYK